MDYKGMKQGVQNDTVSQHGKDFYLKTTTTCWGVGSVGTGGGGEGEGEGEGEMGLLEGATGHSEERIFVPNQIPFLKKIPLVELISTLDLGG